MWFRGSGERRALKGTCAPGARGAIPLNRKLRARAKRTREGGER